MAERARSKMQYVQLGSSGLKVSRIILGCMTYGTPGWQMWTLPEEIGLEHIKKAYDAGINTFDTANMYSNGESEVILGKAIKKYNLPRDEIVVMTKVGLLTRRDPMTIPSPKHEDDYEYVNQKGLSRKHIFESVKHSLGRLQLDYVDVLQCHRFDYETPIAETMQALHDVVKAGYVRYIGMSSCWAYQFHAMQNYAIANQLTPFVSMQNLYNLLYREEEREMMSTLKLFGVGSIPWSPLARGLLTRPVNEKDKTRRGATDLNNKVYSGSVVESIITRVEKLALKKGVNMAQISFAWLLHKNEVTAPVVGITSLENLYEVIDAVQLKLTPEDLNGLEELYEPRKAYGHA